MAKQIVLNVLQSVLSDFLEIDEDNFDLNLAVWSGSIVLHNVKLKTDKLFRNFNLSYVHGVVRTLEVQIPWTALMNSPVRINIDGVYLQVKPMNVSALDKNQTRNRLKIMKQEKIDFADKFIDFNKGGKNDCDDDEDEDDSDGDDADEDSRQEKRSRKKKEKEKGWMETWTSKIVDNLEISLENIHVRYEDTHTLNGSTYSAGVTLSRFVLTTCDANWNTSFVARSDEPIRKLCKVENFGFYWNMSSQSLEGLDEEAWTQAMHSIIYRSEDYRHNDHEDSIDLAKRVEFMKAQRIADGSRSEPGSMKYIVQPTNKLVVKVLHNDHLVSPGDTPKYDVSIVNEELGLSLDGLQYKQLNQTLEMIGAVEAKRQPYMYKPLVRPIGRESCRQWWKYAFKLVVKRPRYIQLVKLSKTVNPKNQFESMLTHEDKQEMEALEERLSMHTIIVFRHMAADEMAHEVEEARRRAKRAQGTKAKASDANQPKVVQGRTWMQFLQGHPKPGEAPRAAKVKVDEAGIHNDDTEGFGSWDDHATADSDGEGEGEGEGEGKHNSEDDIAVENIISSLEEHSKKQSSKKRSHNTFLALSLESSAKLDLSQYGVGVLSASMAVSARARVSHMGTNVVLDIGDVMAADKITPTPALPNFISVKSTSESEQFRQDLLQGSGTWKSASLEPQQDDMPENLHSLGRMTGKEVRKPSFTVTFEQVSGKNVLKIASLPLEFCLNKLCVQHIIGIFFYPRPPPLGKSQEEAAAHMRRKRQEAREALMKATSGMNAPSKDANEFEKGKREEGSKPQKREYDSAFELIFEAHAPKIIVPQDSSRDQGYLLLDTGLLKVRGLVGPEGMSWDLSLNHVNAGMPLHSADMYNLESLSDLYLIKPFDIGCQIQNIDKSAADMNVDVAIDPEFRGELNARKLERLLQVLGVASQTLFQKPAFDLPEMGKLKGLDKEPHMYKRSSGSSTGSGIGMADVVQLAREAHRKGAASPVPLPLNPDMPPPAPAGDDLGAQCGSQPSTSLSSPFRESQDREYETDLVDGGDNVEIKSLIRDMDHATRSEKQAEELVLSQDPTLAGLRITIKIPRVALDLSYDDFGHHLVFEVTQLEALLVNRPHDLSVELNFGGMSIQDSMREEAQKYLACTPALPSGGNFIHISYVNVQNRLSPYFRNHGAELRVEFANLQLDLDVMTLMHLRPFIIVLLHNKKEEGPKPATTGASMPAAAVDQMVDNSNIPLTQKPFGMHMVFSMQNLGLDIMRVGEENIEEGAASSPHTPSADARLKLDETFSLQIFDLRADIDNRGLMIADVQLRSVEVVDIREISRDYAIKKVFGPMRDGGVPSSSEGAHYDDKEDDDIIRVWYKQDTREMANLDVLVSNASTYASTDTFLDLSNVALGNFQAFIQLLSAPPERESTLASNKTSFGSSTGDMSALRSAESEEEDVFVDVPDSGKYQARQAEAPQPPSRPAVDPIQATFQSATASPPASDAVLDGSGGDSGDGHESGTDGARPSFAQPTRQTMIIKATVKNPRLCLIDDPTTEASSAIIGTCGLELQMTRDMRIDDWLDKRELRESLHMSIRNLQLSTVRSMQEYVPHAILQPLGIEFNMRRDTFNGQLLSSSISVDTDNANAILTMNDLVLAKSVFTRRSTSDDQANKQANEALLQQHQMYQLQQESKYQLRQEPLQLNNSSLTNHTFTFNLGRISLVALNDFQGNNTPVARMLLEESKFCIARGQGMLFGDGDFFASADFYNQQLYMWEPILDRWHPTLQIVTEDGEIKYNVKSDHTMQMTVSGMMLETFMKSYSLLLSLSKDEDTTAARQITSEVFVQNKLGAPISLDVIDSASKTKIMSLNHGEKREIVPVIGSNDSAKLRASSLAIGIPSHIDISFTGSFAEQRTGLSSLPLSSAVTRLYHLLPKMGGSEGEKAEAAERSRREHRSGEGTLDGASSLRPELNQLVVIEPIEEEAFEYARYDPITSKWRKPFLAADPHQWSDANGSVDRPIESISLGSDRWEWQGRWEVCMRGRVGVDFDEEGWEYSTSFNKFSMTSHRRSYKNLDSCRRRKWLNARVPKAGSLADKKRPLNVHWDVQVMTDGTKVASLRSAMQVRNDLPYSVDIVLSYVSWETDVHLGPIKEGEVFDVPLLCSYATSMKVRPTDIPYGWTEGISCSVQTYDFSNRRDLRCESDSFAPLCIRTFVSQQGKSVLVSLSSYIVIANRLPCDVRFRMSARDNRQEDGEVACGDVFKLAYLDYTNHPKLSVCIDEGFRWTKPVTIECSPGKHDSVASEGQVGKESTQRVTLIELPHSAGKTDPDADNSVIVSMTVDVGNNVNITLFSRYIMIDHTGLGVSVLSNKRHHEEMVRHTFTQSPPAPTGRNSSRSSVNVPSSPPKRSGKPISGEDFGLTLDSKASASCGSEEAVTWKDSTSPQKGGVTNEAPSHLIADLTVDSKYAYEVANATHGDIVYTDRRYIWTHLPEELRGECCIRTPCNDKLRRSRHMIRFRAQRPLFLLVLADSRKAMKWLRDDGFQDLVGHAIARRVLRGTLQEVYFTIHGKYFPTDSYVELRGNYSKDITTMYTVFAVPAPDMEDPQSVQNQVSTSSMLSQIHFHQTYDRSLPNRCWLDGGEGLALFYTAHESMRIGLAKDLAALDKERESLQSGRGSAAGTPRSRATTLNGPRKAMRKGELNWSDDIRISMTRVQHSGSFEVIDWDTRMAYQLAYRMRFMPGAFANTQEVVILPQFCVVNLMDEEIMMVQRGTRQVKTYFPYQSAGWHKSDVNQSTTVQMRSKSSFWSLGTIDLSEIGSSTLHLPRKDDSADGSKVIILHVEVKVARPEEMCGVVVLVWKSSTDNHTDMCIQNQTELPITVMQDGIRLDEELSRRKLFQICVAPMLTVPFGWADPDLDGFINVAIGTCIDSEDAAQRVVRLSMLQTGERIRLSDGVMNKDRSHFGEVILSVLAMNGMRVLRITRPDRAVLTHRRSSASAGAAGAADAAVSSTAHNDAPKSLAAPPVPASAKPLPYQWNFTLASFGLSLVVEKPVRREFLSLYVDDMVAKYRCQETLNSLEFSILNMQIDNYSESCIHPVLLHDLLEDQSEGKDEKDEEAIAAAEIPLLQLVVVKENPAYRGSNSSESMSIYKYAVCRVMPMAFQVDSATIQLLYTDLLNDLKYVTKEQTVASTAPSKWMSQRNLYLTSAESREIVDVYQSKARAQMSKLYVERMILHPMKFRVTFVQTPFPRKGSMNVTLQSTFMNVITSLAGIEKMELKLKSFEVSQALESVPSLRSAVVQKTWQDMKGQLGSVLGSMAALGSPLGFGKKIGAGFNDLFYEPYQGAMHSPADFISGVGKGASSLASNVVSGVFGSLGAMTGTASRGIGYLSGDGDYVRRRALKKQRRRAQGGGFFDGLLDGGDSIASGISSGLSGLVTRPVEEARKSGAKGFVKGVGLGILGAVVKPIMGVTDAVTGVATGISNQVANEAVFMQVRPVRAMVRGENDHSILIIAPMNVKAAYAQEFVAKRAKAQHYEDAFLNYLVINTKTDEAIILSETYVYWRKERSLWGRTWANVSHVLFFGHAVGVYLYASKATDSSSVTSDESVVTIPCGSKDKALRVYETLARNAFRMGNPANVIPLSIVQQEAWLADKDFRAAVMAERGLSCTLDNKLDGYLFGSYNRAMDSPGMGMSGKSSKLKKDLRAELEKPLVSWASLDKKVWNFICLWDSSHRGIQASRVCMLTIINRSDSPVQIARINMEYGREISLFGTIATGYESESRCVMPGGAVIVFSCGYHPSPIEVGHVKTLIDCPSFTATVASTQRESACESKSGFQVGFIEKCVSEWFAKYCLCIS